MVRPGIRTAARRFACALFALALAVPTTLTAQETQDTTRLPAPMRQARASFIAGFAGLDAAAAGSMFADSAVVDFQGQIISGKPAIAQGWIPEMLTTLSAIRFGGSTYVIGETEIVENGTHYVTPNDGSGEQMGSHQVRWRRMQDGRWRVIRLNVIG